ncbi:MAG: TetR/AcrR family transcriptional regulator [Rhodobacteraceae bacterium]|nr:TetR/AcrR family transcriptional regulator [Paracoccaceae bacterium]
MARKDDPRDRYLNIATRKFAEQGFHGVSLAGLAREAGVSKQAFLHFYASKEKLYGAVLARLADDLCADLERFDRDETADARLIRHFEDLAKGAAHKEATARLVVRALLDSDPEAQMWPMKRYLDMLVRLAQVVPALAGRPAADLGMRLFQMMGAIHYVQISQTAMDGMFGAQERQLMEQELVRNISAEVRMFVAGR